MVGFLGGSNFVLICKKNVIDFLNVFMLNCTLESGEPVIYDRHHQFILLSLIYCGFVHGLMIKSDTKLGC